jgi:aminoglycoside phosphotransferase family enzyme
MMKEISNRKSTMSDLIRDLANPENLPDRTENVTVIQTHISIVFVGDAFVYKVKKPVNFGFLDFSTLKKRQHFCHKEVVLNRRLAKNLYLGVLPVHFDGRRHVLGSGKGDIVEYAVKMKRIPEDRLMDHVFDRGKLDGQSLMNVAAVLARFHASAETSPRIAEYGRAERFKINTDENFEQVDKYQGITVEKEAFRAIRKWTDLFYTSFHELFSRRISQGRVRDCHGDLHMEHICLTPDLPIFDCIEFNERFRYSDTVADMAFLLMDLEFHGGYREAEDLWKRYKALAKEDEGQIDALVTFYKVYRAVVRGKVNSFRMDDSTMAREEKDKVVETASRYFKLAYSYIV